MDHRSGQVKGVLEGLYAKYNRYELIAPDPLQFVYRYKRAVDMEAGNEAHMGTGNTGLDKSEVLGNMEMPPDISGNPKEVTKKKGGFGSIDIR